MNHKWRVRVYPVDAYVSGDFPIEFPDAEYFISSGSLEITRVLLLEVSDFDDPFGDRKVSRKIKTTVASFPSNKFYVIKEEME